MAEDNVDDFQYSFSGILISIFAIMLIAPLTSGMYASLIVTVFLGGILISSALTLASHRITFLAGSLLGISSLIFLSLDFFVNSWWIRLFSLINSSLLIGMTAAVHFKTIFKTKIYTTNTVFGTICVYLLIGFLFALLYGIVEHIQPGSFKGFYTSTINSPSLLDFGGIFQNLLYFSFVTQTTLGYGDIVPQTFFTQNLTVIQVVFGQFYIAVVVAGIIGKMLRNKD